MPPPEWIETSIRVGDDLVHVVVPAAPVRELAAALLPYLDRYGPVTLKLVADRSGVVPP
jgi:hypothetical protein